MKKKTILKLIIVLIIALAIITCSSISFGQQLEAPATEKDVIEEFASSIVSGILAIIALIIRLVLALVWFVFINFIGIALGSSGTMLTIENFIFNKFELTSLRAFTLGSTNTYSNLYASTAGKWFLGMLGVAAVMQLIILIYLAINSVVKTLRQDPKKDAEIKKMIKDYLVGILILFGMGIFVLAVIWLNNILVDILAKGLTTSSGVQNVTTDLLLNAMFSFNPSFGFLNLILYIIVSTMGIIFFIYYLKRLIKVTFLIVISPLVALTYSIDRRKGGAAKLMLWTRMFVFSVFAQVIHAILYLALIKVIVDSINGSVVEAIPAIIISVAGVKFIWDAENIINQLFGIPVDKVQTSAAALSGFLVATQTFTAKAAKVARPTAKLDTTQTPKLMPKDTGSKHSLKRPESNAKLHSGDKSKIKETRDAKIGVKAKDKSSELSGYKKAMYDANTKDRMLDKAKAKGKQYWSAMAESAAIKKKSILSRASGKAMLSGAAKMTAGAMFSVASHATPQINTLQGYYSGAMLAGTLQNIAENRQHKRKYKGAGADKTADNEARQLRAIEERKKNLGPEPEDELDERKLKEEYDNRMLDQSSSTDLPEEKEEKIEEDKDKDKDKDTTTTEEADSTPKGEVTEGQDLETYVKSISEKSKDDLHDQYRDYREDSIKEYMKRTGATRIEAQTRARKLQKDLLKQKTFNYKALADADKAFLHKYLDTITKDKIEVYEEQTEKKQYKDIVKRANNMKIEKNSRSSEHAKNDVKDK